LRLKLNSCGYKEREGERGRERIGRERQNRHQTIEGKTIELGLHCPDRNRPIGEG
jgi:hypothetical protein